MSYIIGSFRILRIGKSLTITNNISNIKLIVELADNRYGSSIFELYIWGNLVNVILDYYKIDDLILIKGYLSGTVSVVSNETEELKNIRILRLTVIKIYLISSNI